VRLLFEVVAGRDSAVAVGAPQPEQVEGEAIVVAALLAPCCPRHVIGRAIPSTARPVKTVPGGGGANTASQAATKLSARGFARSR